jgi:hypothetical protein
MSSKCSHCGSKDHSTNNCPHQLFSTKCSSCGSKNHSTKDCPHNSFGTSQRNTSEDSDASAVFFYIKWGMIICIGIFVLIIATFLAPILLLGYYLIKKRENSWFAIGGILIASYLIFDVLSGGFLTSKIFPISPSNTKGFAIGYFIILSITLGFLIEKITSVSVKVNVNGNFFSKKPIEERRIYIAGLSLLLILIFSSFQYINFSTEDLDLQENVVNIESGTNNTKSSLDVVVEESHDTGGNVTNSSANEIIPKDEDIVFDEKDSTLSISEPLQKETKFEEKKNIIVESKTTIDGVSEKIKLTKSEFRNSEIGITLNPPDASVFVKSFTMNPTNHHTIKVMGNRLDQHGINALGRLKGGDVVVIDNVVLNKSTTTSGNINPPKQIRVYIIDNENSLENTKIVGDFLVGEWRGSYGTFVFYKNKEMRFIWDDKNTDSSRYSEWDYSIDGSLMLIHSSNTERLKVRQISASKIAFHRSDNDYYILNKTSDIPRE